ncbi:MAG TPA: hypothetical protein VE079_02935 [Ensifer sp.]|nr:hypothetical protein [Ensifer sp.]
MRGKLILSTFLFSWLATAAASEAAAPMMCLVRVANSEPGEAENFEAWRMVNTMKTFPGIPMPIIYNNRGGAFTINDDDSLVKISGMFPENEVHDEYARDPISGVVVGVNRNGIYKIAPGEHSFIPLAEKEKLHGNPTSIVFINRWKSFVFRSGTHLYKLSEDWKINELPVRNWTPDGPGRVFDLPTVDALLLEDKNAIYVYRKSGSVEKIADLEKFDFVDQVDSLSQSEIRIQTHRFEYLLTVSSNPAKDGSAKLEVSPKRDRKRDSNSTRSDDTRIIETSWGATYSWSAHSLSERRGNAIRTIATSQLFDPANPKARIQEVIEFPSAHILVILTSASGIFMLSDDNIVSKIPGSENIGVPFFRTRGVIPVRQSMLIVGQSGLYLLSKRIVAPGDRCIAEN